MPEKEESIVKQKGIVFRVYFQKTRGKTRQDDARTRENPHIPAFYAEDRAFWRGGTAPKSHVFFQTKT
ncbi:MAG: hypothetical protein VB062_06585 [Christensenella sp.]|nr:hypothetical protein [Christensenella sp.]